MLEVARVRISPASVKLSGTVAEIFDFLDNNGGLTEEFLYQHQPLTENWLNVYATNRKPIGRLDMEVAQKFGMTILSGPVVVVARKGYAGRLFVVNDPHLVVQEDAYAVRPKPHHATAISLDWFAAHYTEEFQSLRTSEDGIGDFPRTLLRRRRVDFPDRVTQDRLAMLYRRRDNLMRQIGSLGTQAQKLIMDKVIETPTLPSPARP